MGGRATGIAGSADARLGIDTTALWHTPHRLQLRPSATPASSLPRWQGPAASLIVGAVASVAIAAAASATIATGIAAAAQARSGSSAMASQSSQTVRGREGRNIGGGG